MLGLLLEHRQQPRTFLRSTVKITEQPALVGLQFLNQHAQRVKLRRLFTVAFAVQHHTIERTFSCTRKVGLGEHAHKFACVYKQGAVVGALGGKASALDGSPDRGVRDAGCACSLRLGELGGVRSVHRA